MSTEKLRYIPAPEIEVAEWRKISVESNLPDSLQPLRELSKNLWWVWSNEARELFQYIDEEIWEECEHNPILLLDKVSYNRLLELTRDEGFIEKMHRVYNSLNAYLEERKSLEGPQVAYFSMEYGLHDSLKIFSGGLGILAGDYLKEASDSRVNLVAVGLLYRFGYFKQTLNLHGEQMANYEAQQFTKIPVQPAVDKDGNWVNVEVQYPGRNVVARVWQVNIGSVKLFLLDTDHTGNSDEDRFVTHHLYGGDNENRLKQELLLGLGGIKALKQLGYDSNIYHCNEGHAAFIGIERIINLINEKGLSFAEAQEVVRASTVFTTHTPVPAGHDSFHNDMFKHYMNSFPDKLGLKWDEFDMLGKAHKTDDHFNMSYLASNLSQGINGVSMLHGDVSKEVLKDMYHGFLPEELEIGYVTNGVHYPSWTAPEWRSLHKRYFGEHFPANQLDFDVWKNIYNVPDHEIWELRKTLRLKMINYIKQRFTNNWIKRNENPKIITEILGKLNPNSLTIGFARRFATYKRAHLLFRNLDRLAKIVNNPERPVQFIFAGKAHPADKAGQDLIKHIVDVSKRPEFRGKILFVQNYDINLAKMLLQGVDVWMNTPTRPLEASGTSGEKGVMNGTLHFSVLDGWWVEGYRENAGWALPAERAYDVQDFQDELDAETIYNILEDEVVPSYYERNMADIPERWIGYVKNTIAQVAPNFTTGRMIRDYQDRYYNPQFERASRILADDYKLAKDLVAWKEYIISKWKGVNVKKIEMVEGFTTRFIMGNEYPVKVTVDLNGLSPKEVGVELVITETSEEEGTKIFDAWEFEPQGCQDKLCTYSYLVKPAHPGSFNYSFRLFPKHENLPHRQDFKYIKWI
ncbi:alpha-glucan family phosphorylase [Maribellus mangrovi]|uniref:alpha-glucan family phosphorylase n=1 Tax=Maribellus mangrovi TaxID=3133146 RepID=UPI0030ED2442